MFTVSKYKITKRQQMDGTIENLGKKIKLVRVRKGLTQDSLAARSGLTKSYISLLEAGKKVPAISTLSRIAVAFGLRIGEFFESSDDPSDVAVVRKNERLRVKQRGSPFGYIYEALSLQKKDRLMDPFIVEVLPGDKSKKIEFEHAGEEFDFVVKGRIKYIINDQEYILEEGDSIYFDSGMKHRVEALGNKSALTLSVHASRH
jgi:transcriptional regulator with XRE-family HTH domain